MNCGKHVALHENEMWIGLEVSVFGAYLVIYDVFMCLTTVLVKCFHPGTITTFCIGSGVFSSVHNF
jgi:hypothetical protein